MIVLALGGCGQDNKPAADTSPDAAAKEAVQTAVEKQPEVAPAPPPLSTQDQFWNALGTLCGSAYAGYLTVGTEPGDREFGEADMTMHVRDCSDDEIRIPFHVGDNRSRTWVLRRDGDGLTLKHQHLDENGDIQEPHNYGGRTSETGSARRQAFVVDAQTRSKLPATQYNVWAIEIVPGQLFAYELQRPEEDRFFRVEFDLDAAIAAPPPAWGYRADSSTD
ncbi:MAG: hypothetical protein AB8G16_02880 [Gammaproteobacteria bacterium]